MTTNACESYNCVLKCLQDWAEVPVDVITQGLMHLCQYHNIEIMRGRYGLGTYQIRPSLEQFYDRAKDKPVFPRTLAPEEIVDDLKAGLAVLKKEVYFSAIVSVLYYFILLYFSFTERSYPYRC